MGVKVLEILLGSICFGLLGQFFLFTADSDFPISLMFGPIMYYSYLILAHGEKRIWILFLHLLPFIGIISSFLLVNERFYAIYLHFYFITLILSLVVYPSIIIFSGRKGKNPLQIHNLLILELLSILCYVGSFFVFVMYMDRMFELNLELYPRMVVMAILFVCITIVGYYFYQINTNQLLLENNPPEQTEDQVERIRFNEQQIRHYKLMLTQSMEHDKLYLDANLTLEKVAKHVSIPKNHITHFLNYYYATNFYEWLAKYRINHAISLIESGSENLKLEFLANLSGFNSRTTFNRYFKMYMGESPSNYRLRLSK